MIAKACLIVVLLSVPAFGASKPNGNGTKKPDIFYVYAEKNSKDNHYIPSGWMGDYGDLKIDDANKESPKDGSTAIKWTYNAQGAQGAHWAGVFWQHPANNWGEKQGGYDLTGYKQLTFWAKGSRVKPAIPDPEDKGGPIINEFKVGGITGEYGDSDVASIGPIELTSEWKKYTIDLRNINLAHIIGGFCWATAADKAPHGMVMYLDEIRFER